MIRCRTRGENTFFYHPFLVQPATFVLSCRNLIRFFHILIQARAELGDEEGLEIDKNEAFAQLAKTLNKLMSKLERTEKGKIKQRFTVVLLFSVAFL